MKRGWRLTNITWYLIKMNVYFNLCDLMIDIHVHIEKAPDDVVCGSSRSSPAGYIEWCYNIPNAVR